MCNTSPRLLRRGFRSDPIFQSSDPTFTTTAAKVCVVLIGLFQGKRDEFLSFLFISVSDGGVLWAVISSLLIQDSVFETNNASFGGAIYATSNLEGRFAMRNTLFIGNSAFLSGGAVYASEIDVDLANCSFIANHVRGTDRSNGGAIAIFLLTLNASNCLFSYNSAQGSGGSLFACFSSSFVFTILLAAIFGLKKFFFALLVWTVSYDSSNSAEGDLSAQRSSFLIGFQD